MPIATATSAQQPVRTKPSTAASRPTMNKAMMVALNTSTTLIWLVQRASAGMPRDRNVVPNPAKQANVAQPR